jgi:hypothetical protein
MKAPPSPESFLPVKPNWFHVLLSLTGQEQDGYRCCDAPARLTDENLIAESDRRPAPDEKRRLLDLLDKELASFENRPEDAAALLNGESKGSADLRRLAAWTAVSRVLLNLDETITRE